MSAIPNPHSEFFREPNLLVPGGKPVGMVKIDWMHSLADRIQFCSLFAPQRTDLVTDDVLLRNLNGTFPANYYQQTAVNNTYISGGKVILFEDEMTWVGRLVPEYATASTPGKTIMLLETATDEVCMFWYNAASDDYKALMKIAGSDKTVELTVNDSFENQDITLALRYNGSVLSMWKDGVEVAQNLGLSGNILNPTQVLSHGANRTGTNPYAGKLFHSYLWNRALSDRETVDVYKDPYQFLIPA